jgi:PAS domain S-box-containing protein
MAPQRIEDLDDARRLQLLVEGVVDYALYTISLDGLIVSWNSGARRLKGYEAAEIIGLPYATFFSAEDRERGLPAQHYARRRPSGASKRKAGAFARTAAASGPWR